MDERQRESDRDRREAIERVAETLVQLSEPSRLRLVLDHIVRLRDALYV